LMKQAYLSCHTHVIQCLQFHIFHTYPKIMTSILFIEKNNHRSFQILLC
jgi:hypothetical protein